MRAGRMSVTDDNEYVIFETSVLLPGGGNDLLNLDKKRFDLLRGGYCVGDTGPGFFIFRRKMGRNIAQIVFVLIE